MKPREMPLLNEDKLTHRFDASGQGREMTIINESGLYSLIFSSKLPCANMFKCWVTSEVLQAIRRNGGYIVGQENNRMQGQYFWLQIGGYRRWIRRPLLAPR